MTHTLGVVSVGQSGRDDFLPSMRAVLGEGVQIVLKGALDGLRSDDFLGMAPESGAHPIVTKLADGTSVVVSKPALTPLINRCFRELAEEGVGVAALMCTGTFAGLEQPEGLTVLHGCEIINNCTRAVLAPGSNLGVLVPLPSQEAYTGQKFRNLGYKVTITHGNPYASTKEILSACEVFRSVDLVVLHCMGFNREQRRLIEGVCGKPVLQGNSLIARMAAEVLGL